jgi:signal transduction histidine kinase
LACAADEGPLCFGYAVARMKPFPNRSLLSIAVASALAAVLVALALLQFDWVNKVAQAEQDRMESDLETAIVRFRWDFYTQLLDVCSAFQVEQADLSKNVLQAYADRYDDWTHASSRPRLVASIYVWKARRGNGDRLFRLNSLSGRFESTGWPAKFETIRSHLKHNPAQVFNHMGPAHSLRRWNLVEQVPALVHAFWDPRQASSGRSGAISPAGYVIIELNLKYMQSSLFPLLRERYFHGRRRLLYRVSIVSQSNPGAVIYQSAPSPQVNAGSPPDAVVELIPMHAGFLESLFPDQLSAAPGVARANDPLASYLRRQLANRRAPVVVLAGSKADWQMVVRHRTGSVHAAVVELRLRDLAVSLGVLLILAVSMALIVVSAQRAQRLARIQMDFVAGISHELRTPLAVICSAAENLADGVVGAGDQVREYGALIRNEGRHLAQMVEQTLGFAAQQVGRPSEDRAAVGISAVIDEALVQSGLTLKDSTVEVEKQIEPGLPPVMADAPAITRCVQNLLANAVKYGGDNRWVRVCARSVHGRRRPEVEIVIEDKGIGIDPGDLPHIFEPFYRGRSPEVAHVPGTGLGLSLARDIAESMGGLLSVKSEIGKGSVFTLRLPTLTASERSVPSEPRSPGLKGYELAKK